MGVGEMGVLDVVTFGEAMAMFMADQEGELHEVEHFTRALAGAETNVSVGLARLAFQVGWVSKVGDDPFGKFIVQTLQGENVDTSRVQVDSQFPTGFQLKSKVHSGDPQVQYFRKGSAASTISPPDLDKSYFLQSRHLHMTGIPLALSSNFRNYAESALEWMKSSGRSISFDPNLRPNLWPSRDVMVEVINSFAKRATIVMPGISEGEILTGYTQPQDIAEFYIKQGVELVVIKLGAKGAYYQTAKEGGFVEGFHVEHVVDTVGAGDGFAVGVISGLLEGLSMLDTLIRANAIGALAVMSPGDMDGLPTRKKLVEYLNLNGKGVKLHDK
jgi:2-dehydro-3-deoxygluconokinase